MHDKPANTGKHATIIDRAGDDLIGVLRKNPHCSFISRSLNFANCTRKMIISTPTARSPVPRMKSSHQEFTATA